MNPKSMTQSAIAHAPIAPDPTRRRHAGRSRLGRDESIGVGLLVDEPERVDRLEAGVTLGQEPGSSRISSRASADSRK